MKKGRLINLEWMCDNNFFTEETFLPIKTKLIKDDIDRAVDDGINLILGFYLLDGFLPINDKNAFISHLTDIRDYALSKGIEEFYFISGHGETLGIELPVPTFFYDNVFRLTVNTFQNRLDKFPKAYNPNKKKALFLGGMPERVNRIGLLSKFYDQGLLGDFIDWTFFPPWTNADKKWCRQHLSHYSDEKYEKFIKDCDKRFDDRFLTAAPWYGNYSSDENDIPWYEVRDTDWIKNPNDIDPIVFSNTFFSIISEGPNYWGNNRYDFLTEKTYRTMIARHPFIFAGWPDQFRYLKKLGFKTFEEYLPIKDYAYIEDDNKRMDAVVENTKYLLNHREWDEEISKDVDYNYNRVFEYAKEQDQMTDYWHKEFGIPMNELDLVFLKRIGYSELIMNVPEECLPKKRL